MALRSLSRVGETGLPPPERSTMDTRQTKAQRLVALCLLGFLLFNYPVLALFNQGVLVLGVPLIYAYLFAAWAVLITLLALVVRRGNGA